MNCIGTELRSLAYFLSAEFKDLPLPFLVNMVVPSPFLAFGPHSYAITANLEVGTDHLVAQFVSHALSQSAEC